VQCPDAVWLDLSCLLEVVLGIADAPWSCLHLAQAKPSLHALQMGWQHTGEQRLSLGQTALGLRQLGQQMQGIGLGGLELQHLLKGRPGLGQADFGPGL
jgi:hypothetical protein